VGKIIKPSWNPFEKKVKPIYCNVHGTIEPRLACGRCAEELVVLNRRMEEALREVQPKIEQMAKDVEERDKRILILERGLHDVSEATHAEYCVKLPVSKGGVACADPPGEGKNHHMACEFLTQLLVGTPDNYTVVEVPFTRKGRR
jgi:uncharacterized metal-binding protein YceD (DUF177 family)